MLLIKGASAHIDFSGFSWLYALEVKSDLITQVHNEIHLATFSYFMIEEAFIENACYSPIAASMAVSFLFGLVIYSANIASQGRKGLAFL